jgi:hypothetical protein
MLERAEHNQKLKALQEHFDVDPKKNMRSSLRGSGEPEIDIDWKDCRLSGTRYIHSIPKALEKTGLHASDCEGPWSESERSPRSKKIMLS